MGQRLNIEIHRNGQLLANSYMHWSGFTDEALELTKEILRKTPHIKQLPSDFTDREIAVWLLQGVAGGLCDDGSSELVRPFFPKALSRNHGLISLTDKGMGATRDWEEGRVTIDFAKEAVDFDVFFKIRRQDYDDEEWEEYYGEAESLIIGYNIHEVKFNDFDHFFSRIYEKDFLNKDGDHYIAPIR